jgi:triosephosphate isomerase (TIM)
MERKMRIPLIAANWKMNTTPLEASALVKQMLPELNSISGVETLVCPPFISIVSVSELLRGSSVELGAQNAYFEDKGAFTGEVSPPMLAAYCKYVILGHSERRSLFGESSQIVSKKLKAVFKAGMKPILCVGESLSENESGHTESVVTTQLRQSLDGIADASGLVIAYEPVWAIGTGRAATAMQAESTIKMIRDVLSSIFRKDTADATRILYGGSANGSNIAEFISEPDIDGALVGGASLKPAEFVRMVKQTAEIKASL